MLLRAPVARVKSKELSKRDGYLAIVMRHYPRYMPKALVDEYSRALAPDEELFRDFKTRQRELKDHNLAFEQVHYQDRFCLKTEGFADLQRLSTKAKAKDVYLICQCSYDDRCHCDLLLLLARHHFGVMTSQLPFAYPCFLARLERGELELS